MKLCAVSDGLGHLAFEDAAKASAELGLAALEICTGNWSGAPHANLQSLLESKNERRDFLSVLERNSLSLAVLNCRSVDLSQRVLIDEPSDYSMPAPFGKLAV